MSGPRPPYYPPRAPWYASLREVGYSMASVTRVDRLRTPDGIGWIAFATGLVLPGYGFAAHGRTKAAGYLLASWAACVVVGLAFLGLFASGLFFGLAMSIHATSVVFLFAPWLRELDPRRRIVVGLATVGALACFLYLPLQDLVAARVFTPIRVGNETVVVRGTRDPTGIRRGDWIAFHQPRVNTGSVIFEEGVGFGPVYGLPGETIEFAESGLRIGAKTYPRESDMPTSGSVSVPADSWFVWSKHETVRWVGIPGEVVSAAILAEAIVSKDRLRGRPYARWFHRAQAFARP